MSATETQTSANSINEYTIVTETAGVNVEVEVEVDESTDVACPGCGAVNDGEAQVCDQCGCAMQGDAEDQAEPPETPGETPDPEDVGEGPEMSTLPTWESELAYEGMPTSDGRYLIPGGITNRDLPLSLMCQTVTADGHDGAVICGKLTNIWRVDRPDLGDGVVAVMGSGEFSDIEMGPTAAQLVEEEVLRGVSVDISPSKRVLLDAKTREEVAPDQIDFEAYANGEYLVGIEGEIMGATLVPFPAFADARMRVFQPDAVTAAAGSAGITVTTWSTPRLIPVAITAAAAGKAPLRPPRDWFFMQEPEGKCPLTVTDEGLVYGHLATWDQCHHGFANECVLAKPSRTDYSLFHVGAIKTKEGEEVAVGRIVVGEGGHASISYGAVDTNKFYDRTSMVGAFVRAVDGKYGIWLSGAVRSDCPAERVRDMLANPPSGDWRRHNGWLELIAALSVPVPGFPVPRYEYALAASADAVEVDALIATGYYEVEPPSFSRAEQRRRDVLLSQARELTKE